jgi:hypothetical protein
MENINNIKTLAHLYSMVDPEFKIEFRSFANENRMRCVRLLRLGLKLAKKEKGKVNLIVYSNVIDDELIDAPQAS